MCLLIRTLAFRLGRFDGLASRFFRLASRFFGLAIRFIRLACRFGGLFIRFIRFAATARWVFG